MGPVHSGIAPSNASKAAAVVMTVWIMPTVLPSVGAFYDCAALLGGNGHWLDIATHSVPLSI
jgi:hypothetical protein